MANDNLTSQTIASTYNQLLITADTGGITGSGSSATQIHCGAATAGAGNADTTALYLSTTRVGIGTVSPSDTLHVAGDCLITAADGVADNAWVCTIQNLESTNDRSFGLNLQAGSTSSDTSMRVQDHDGANTHFYIRGDGNVGIGTATPGVINTYDIDGGSDTAFLHIKSGVPGIMLEDSTISGSDYNVRISANDQNFYIEGAKYSDGTSLTAMTVECDTGNVGIGIDAPTHMLHVSESRDGQAAALIDNNHADGDGLYIQLGTDSPDSGDFWLKLLDNSGAVHGSIVGNGDNSTATWTSDRRLKENIIDLPDAMSMISKIKPRTFTWKSATSHNHINYGFIADEWFDVFPNSVIGQRDSDGNLIPDAMKTNLEGEEIMDRQQVSTDAVIPVLVKAVQELSAKVTTLENA